MKVQRRDHPQQFLHPRNANAYWREAMERELAKAEQASPGIFSQPVPQQEAR